MISNIKTQLMFIYPQREEKTEGVEKEEVQKSLEDIISFSSFTGFVSIIIRCITAAAEATRILQFICMRAEEK